MRSRLSCHIVQDDFQPSIRDQYPRDIVKPAGMKNDVNSMRSVERNESLLLREYKIYIER